MKGEQIISELYGLASDKHKINVVRMGIQEACSISVSTGDARALAKQIGKSDELWGTGLHELKESDDKARV